MTATAELLSKVANDVKEQHAKEIAAYQARRERVFNAVATANQNTMPVRDGRGRYHAPFDGYVWPDTGDEYAGGEFLPFLDDLSEPKMPKEWSKIHRKTRILIKATEYTAFRDEIDQYLAEIGCGKPFEREGMEVCYVYMSCYTESMKRIIDQGTFDYREKAKEAIKESKGAAATGRIAQVATVLAIKGELSRFAYNKLDFKMFIKFENGSTALGTVPNALVDVLKVGDVIDITATFEVGKDETHAYFKRPVVSIKESSSE